MAIAAPDPEGDDDAAADGAKPQSLEEVAAEGPFRIRTVAELTGVPEPTLRAWERRYGVPSPDRTASGYRLYGAAEVQQVRAMRRLCAEGMAAAEAARAVLAEGAEARRRLGTAKKAPGAVSAGGYQAIVELAIGAIARMDQRALEEQIGRGMLLGSATALFDHVFAPVLVRVGELWHAGELSVAEEHFASQRIGLYVRDLTRLIVREDAEAAVIVGSGADDEHEIGSLGVALRLAAWGLRPVYLGPRTPPSAVRTAVETLSPRLVALSMTITPGRARARELLDGYAAACEGVPWIVGGAAVHAIGDLVTKAGGVAALDITALQRIARSVTQHFGSGAGPGEERTARVKRMPPGGKGA